MSAGKGPPFWRHLLGESAKLDPGIAPGLAGAVQGGQGGPQIAPGLAGAAQGTHPIGVGRSEPGFAPLPAPIRGSFSSGPDFHC